MASFGKVLDLLDSRYLSLQDVTGNVEPLPTLVPYEEYAQNVLVYRMDTNHEIFMGLMQDFTMRTAQEWHKELWTWCVQWEVENTSSSHILTSSPSPKKPRLSIEQPSNASGAEQPQRRAPIIDQFERRIIDPELMQEEEMLRILIDIIQVDSSIVPNFIEFLYRWIDFYEGDGKALKAALSHEIPSLWDFEYHPMVLPADLEREEDERKKADKANAGNATQDDINAEVNNKTPHSRKAEEVAQGSPTKRMREKPDLAAIERLSEESERLQYREVKYGIQPPKLNEPLPPLINIPRDLAKRTKYYAACFRSRQRALNLLVEAGVTIRQISNYAKGQDAHPRDTPHDGEGDGLRHYNKDAKAAQARYVEKEKEMAFREKQAEIAISNRLATEAQLAARTAKVEGSSGVPLIPPTPSYKRKPDMAATMLQKIRAARGNGEERINVVPKSLVGKTKSNLLEGAIDKQTLIAEFGFPSRMRALIPKPISSDSDTNDNSEGGDDDDASGPRINAAVIPPPAPNPYHLPFPSLPLPRPPRPLLAPAQPQMPWYLNGNGAPQAQYTPAHGGSPAPVAARDDALTPADIAEYIQDISQEQAQQILSLLNTGARQELVSRIGEQSSGTGAQAPAQSRPSANLNGGNIASTVPSAPTDPTPTRPSLRTTQIPGPTLPPLPSLPLPRLPSAPPGSASAASEPPRPTLPFRPPPHPPTINVTPPQAPRNQSMPPLPQGFEAQERSIAAQRLGMPQLSSPSPRTDQGIQHGDLLSLHRPSDVSGIPATAFGLGPGPTQLTARQFQTPSREQQGSQTAMPQLPPVRPFPTAPGLSALPTPPAFAQRLLAVQRSQNDTVQTQGPQNTGPASPSSLGASRSTFTGTIEEYPALQRPSLEHTSGPSSAQASFPTPPDALQPSQDHTMTDPDPEPHPHDTLAPPSPTRAQPPNPFLSPLRPGIQRNAPGPLDLMPPPPSPLSSLAPSLLATSPFAASAHGMPIQIYLPKIVVPGNLVGPGGTKMGNGGAVETDALLAGYSHPGSGTIVLSKALFLPVGVWTNTLRRVRRNAYLVLETYAPPPSHPKVVGARARPFLGGSGSAAGPGPLLANAHTAVYQKLVQVYGFMVSARDRENDVTKRWRATPGPMTQRDRGAVWEGWGVTLDKGIEMRAEERKGALMSSGLIDEGVEKKTGFVGATVDEAEVERRRREIDELLEEEECGEDEEMEG